MEFNTVSISDGITMGSAGMRASLVSREVITDSIELVARGNLFDALVVPRRLRQDHPGRGDGARPPRHSRAHALRRIDRAGARRAARDVTIQDVFEAIGAHASGTLSDAGLCEMEDRACPGAGACGGQFTANTMATAVEFLGLAEFGSGDVPAGDPEKHDVARRAGALVMEVLRAGRRPRRSSRVPRSRTPSPPWRRPGIDQRRPPPAWRSRAKWACRWGSTTSIASTPGCRCFADLKPGGRFVATDLSRPAAPALVAKRLLDAGALHGDAVTVTGRTIGEEAAKAVETPGQEVVRPLASRSSPPAAW